MRILLVVDDSKECDVAVSVLARLAECGLGIQILPVVFVDVPRFSINQARTYTVSRLRGEDAAKRVMSLNEKGIDVREVTIVLGRDDEKIVELRDTFLPELIVLGIRRPDRLVKKLRSRTPILVCGEKWEKSEFGDFSAVRCRVRRIQ